MPYSGPAAQMERALVQHLTVVRREEVRGEEDEGVGPHQESMLSTPPLVVVEMALEEMNNNLVTLQ